MKIKNKNFEINQKIGINLEIIEIEMIKRIGIKIIKMINFKIKIEMIKVLMIIIRNNGVKRIIKDKIGEINKIILMIIQIIIIPIKIDLKNIKKINQIGKIMINRNNLIGRKIINKNNLIGKIKIIRNNLIGKIMINRNNQIGKIMINRNNLIIKIKKY